MPASSQLYVQLVYGGAGCEPRVLLHELRHYALRVKIILADFNLAVSIQTAKLPNLISRQIFQLYDTSLTKHNTIETGCSESSLFLGHGL